jgi:hypothetical protein
MYYYFLKKYLGAVINICHYEFFPLSIARGGLGTF